MRNNELIVLKHLEECLVHGKHDKSVCIDPQSYLKPWGIETFWNLDFFLDFRKMIWGESLFYLAAATWAGHTVIKHIDSSVAKQMNSPFKWGEKKE